MESNYRDGIKTCSNFRAVLIIRAGKYVLSTTPDFTSL